MRLKLAGLRLLLRALAMTATLAFLLSTIFIFGISTHRSTFLSWNASTPGYGLVQIVCLHGQFQMTIDFAKPGGRSPPPLAPRSWHAGIDYLPGIGTHLHLTDRWTSRIGLDAFLIQSGTYFAIGTFGLYPCLLLWLLVWLTRGKSLAPGHCPSCGYDLRATPDQGGALLARCPECGHVPAVAPAS